MKKHNEYQRALDATLYEQCPKAVFAAIAVSLATTGGDYLEEANDRIALEWHRLHVAGVVPQSPPSWLNASIALAAEREAS